MHLGLLSTLVSAAVASSATAAAEPPLPRGIEVIALRSTVPAGEKIGGKRTGQLCLPAGSIVWADAAPDYGVLAEDVAAGLRARTVDAITAEAAGDAPQAVPPRLRLLVIVTAAHLDACVPQHGLVRLVGGRRKLKVSGTLTVRWRLADPSGAVPTFERDIIPPIAEDDAQSIPSTVARALIDAVPAAVAALVGH